MLKKVNLISFLAVFIVMSSCKKADAPSENDLSPKQMEHALNPNVEQASENVELGISPDGKYPVMTFDEKEFDFGDINQGDKVSHVFEFTNTGDADLVITDARASCGCTVPEYPKDTPIKPGESGKIKVTFNSAGKSGETMKSITISSNIAGRTELLNIKTTIKVPTKGA
jgi:hypothetical protein